MTRALFYSNFLINHLFTDFCDGLFSDLPYKVMEGHIKRTQGKCFLCASYLSIVSTGRIDDTVPKESTLT